MFNKFSNIYTHLKTSTGETQIDDEYGWGIVNAATAVDAVPFPS